LFNSFLPLSKEIEILCVVLTGIGDDGVNACSALNANGARCLTETSESAIVDGMPKAARLLIPEIEVYDVDEIVKEIKKFCE